MKEIHILLVEDSEGDILLTMELFRESDINNRISVVRDGLEAIQFLKKEDGFSNADQPDLILLDINLPKIDGKEVLRFIKRDIMLKSIPVIILTTSCSEMDKAEVYREQANFFITKPVDLDDFQAIIKTIENFCKNTVLIPNTTINAG
jgi:chemotaxis family two-component system response regulator Rcp1